MGGVIGSEIGGPVGAVLMENPVGGIVGTILGGPIGSAVGKIAGAAVGIIKTAFCFLLFCSQGKCLL